MTAEQLYEVASKLKVGDVIEVCRLWRVRSSDPMTPKIESMKIVNTYKVHPNLHINIDYVPCSKPNSIRCGFCTCVSAFDNPAHSLGKWGWQWLRKIGTEAV